jgi:pimeloyl-ACP methyl ester carboxylesterase
MGLSRVTDRPRGESMIADAPSDLTVVSRSLEQDWRVRAPTSTALRHGGVVGGDGHWRDGAAVPPDRERVMTPVAFNNCFGWLHSSKESVASDVAVLLCPGLNRDALDAHYPLRLLADEFAAVGYPTMRFDYPGTGDSCDLADVDGEPAEYWAAWQQSVAAAADWLRDSTGARRLVFCGLRFGAILATSVAEQRDDAVGLILLAPVLRGRSYMRQLSIEAQLQSGAAGSPSDDLNFQELRFSAETVDAISQVDLRQARLPSGCEVAIFSQSESCLLSDCAQAWTRGGAKVACASFDRLEPMLHHNIQGEGRPSDFSAIIDWTMRAVPAAKISCPEISLPSAMLSQPGWAEEPLRFGEGDRLFGMLCRPDSRAGEMAVIITNTGVDPHYGFARFGAELARRLAVAGIVSLRLDFSGLGDSLGVPGKESVVSSIFESDRLPDISAAADVLERLGYHRLAMQGLCSGAYHALQGAVADPRIEILMLVNMPVFHWRCGDTIEFVAHKHAPSDYLRKLRSLATWKQLLQGKFDVRGIIHAQRERLFERIWAMGSSAARKLGWAVSQNPAHLAMAALSRRHAKTLFLYAAEDGGLDVFEQHFGRGDAGLSAFQGASIQVVQGIDHSLSSRGMRRTVAQLMIAFVAASLGT